MNQWLRHDLQALCCVARNEKSGFRRIYLRYKDKANGQRRGEESEEGSKSVDGVQLFFDHKRRRNADQAQNDHIVHANT